ncbi:hypothetical protein BK011_04580 [Tenericutes bacterium MZ-XQ]|nr:hypothetical protein BK011_04580 [Tenericutes bacterium MZ-XQ]
MKEKVHAILKSENIEHNYIEKSKVGFSNLVYFIDDKYVLKVLEPEGNKIKFMNEIGFYKTMNFDFIPNYVSSGEHEGTIYILMERVSGVSLYEIWHTLSSEKRGAVVEQIANILKEINKVQDHKFLQQKYIRDDLVDIWKNAFTRNIEILNQKGYNTLNLLKYAEERVPIIFKEKRLGIVYNDAHFDNFIYDGDKVTLIDFDRVLFTSIDYELLILNTMVNNPKKFASEDVEPFVNPKDYMDIIPKLKKEYGELFNFEYLDERLLVYSFFYMLGNIYTFKLDHLLTDLIEDFSRKTNLLFV